MRLTTAIWQLGKMYFDGIYVEVDLKKAYEYFDYLAQRGNTEAMGRVVYIIFLEENWAKGKRANKAVEYMHKMAEAGDVTGFLYIGDCYKYGYVYGKNIDEAIRWYEKAGEIDAVGYELIGLMYYEGKDVPCDYEKAYYYFTKGEIIRSIDTRYYLATMYYEGLFVNKNPEKAKELFLDFVKKYEEIDLQLNPEVFPVEDTFYRNAKECLMKLN